MFLSPIPIRQAGDGKFCNHSHDHFCYMHNQVPKQCIWRGNNTENSGNLSTWPLVRKLKSKGGLGVLNLSLQNDALLIKHMHKFYSRQDIPWVNLIWSSYYTDKVSHASRDVGLFWWKDIMRT
jgi:hypothetical protein